MEEANELAIKGGYKSPKLIGTGVGVYSDVLLDKDWWVALGKSLGWGRRIDDGHEQPFDKFKQWKLEWHYFIDHLAEGKDTDSFFKDLLSPNN